MSNEELVFEIYNGNSDLLYKLYNKNKGLIRSVSIEIARSFNCYTVNEKTNKISAYTKDILSELDDIGTVEFLDVLKRKAYNPEISKFTTYIYPRIKGKMYAWMCSCLGCMYIPYKAMKNLRKVQFMYHTEGKSAEQISGELNESLLDVIKDIFINTHFLSVYELVPYNRNEFYDPFEYLMADKTSVSADRVAYRRLCIEFFKIIFEELSEKDKNILGHYYGAFGYEKLSLDDIALEEMLTKEGVIEAHKAALIRLKALYHKSKLKCFKNAYREVMREAEKASGSSVN